MVAALVGDVVAKVLEHASGFEVGRGLCVEGEIGQLDTRFLRPVDPETVVQTKEETLLSIGNWYNFIGSGELTEFEYPISALNTVIKGLSLAQGKLLQVSIIHYFAE